MAQSCLNTTQCHTGCRAFSREILELLPFHENSDDFVFDNEMLAQILWAGCTIGEITCPTRYFPEASSIDFPSSVRYGVCCLWTGVKFRLAKSRLHRSPMFPAELENCRQTPVAANADPRSRQASTRLE